MPLLDKKYLVFDEEDVKLMKEMMLKFHEFHRGAGMPDYSTNYVGYLPVFTIALLASQESIERLTKKLVQLTGVMAIFTLVLIVLTFVLLFKGS